MKYFQGEITGVEHLKKLYRSQCKVHHPDKGGKEQDFVELGIEYEALLRKFEFGHDSESNKDLIDDLWKSCQEYNYRKGWVYYKFVELANEPQKTDFDYLGETLGYKKAWAYYKWEEYQGNG